MRRFEIAERLQSLRDALPYVDQVYSLTGHSRKKILDEMKSLEEEQLGLDQGQMVFDENF